VTPQGSAIGEAPEAKLALVLVHGESTERSSTQYSHFGEFNCAALIIAVVLRFEREKREGKGWSTKYERSR